MENRERAGASYKTKETNFVERKTWKFKAAVRKLEMLSASMREVLARPWVGACVPLAFKFVNQCNRILIQSICHQLLYFMTFLNNFNRARVYIYSLFVGF